LTVQKESERQVSRKVDFYNLDMIISVGYRVKPKEELNPLSGRTVTCGYSLLNIDLQVWIFRGILNFIHKIGA